MPCAAGELCRLQELTPTAPNGHECYGDEVADSTVHAATLSKRVATSSNASVPNALLLYKIMTAAPAAAPSAAPSAALSAARAGNLKSSPLSGAGSSKKEQYGAAMAGESGSRTRLI